MLKAELESTSSFLVVVVIFRVRKTDFRSEETFSYVDV